MRLKSRQIPGKELEKLIKALTEVMALFINLLPPRLAKSKVAETIVEYLIYIISALEGTSPTADSGNSHLPGSKDISPPKKGAKQKKGKKRRQGGQPDHKGATLLLTENPNEVVYLTNDRDNLLNNGDFELVKTEKRQVTELRIEKWVTEYRVEFFRNKKTGEVVHGQFPADAKAPAQYGPSVKLLARLLNLGHMIPFERVAKLINSIGSLAMSAGTVFNMCNELHVKPVLKAFRKAAEKSFIASRRCNADETGVKLKGKLFWLHIITDSAFILIFPNKKRGKEAMEAMGIIGKLTHFLCHDCWRPYFHFKNVIHCLCNAHIKRELERFEQMGQKWAIRLKEFLLKLNEMVEAYGGVLPLKIQRAMRRKYRKLLKEGRKETNFPKDKGPPGRQKKRGRPKKKKEHNLIERLEDNEDAVLRFMEDKDVPFSNNDAERPVRSVKIHQKISGTFRSEEYMGNWCLLQSYIMSCNKNGVNPCEALRMLEQDIVPEFIQKVLDRPSKKRKKKKVA